MNCRQRQHFVFLNVLILTLLRTSSEHLQNIHLKSTSMLSNTTQMLGADLNK